VTNLSLANLLQLPIPLPIAEQFETLAEGHQLRIERIISTGQTTAPGEWYDQGLDEWVILLQGQAKLILSDRMATKFPLVRAAHDRNDDVLERIYIGRRFKNDTERLEKLFELYTKMTPQSTGRLKVGG
jgi:hypothetical protein